MNKNENEIPIEISETPKIELHSLTTMRQIEVSWGGRSLLWSYNAWGIQKWSTHDLFFSTNRLLATLSDTESSKLWDIYNDAHNVIESISSFEEIQSELISLVNQIESLFNPTSLKAWAVENGIKENQEFDDVNKTPYANDTTYLRTDIHELEIFSLMIKILMPIFGPYLILVCHEVGNTQKERIASRIVTLSNFRKWPQFIRLVRYSNAYALQRLSGNSRLNAALAYGIASEDLGEVVLGLIIARRLAICTLDNPASTDIIRYIHQFLLDKFIQLSHTEYLDKFPDSKTSSSDPECPSYSDNYRIPESIDRGKTMAANFYAAMERVDQIVSYLNKQLQLNKITAELDKTNVINLTKELLERNEFLIIPEIHTFIPALICRGAEPPILHRMMFRPQRMCRVALANEYCRVLGFNDIASLLIATSKPVDIHSMEMADNSIGVIRKITRDNEIKLESRYPHLSQAQIKIKTNPGKEIINSIVEHIRSNRWENLQDVSMISNSLAELISGFVVHR